MTYRFGLGSSASVAKRYYTKLWHDEIHKWAILENFDFVVSGEMPSGLTEGQKDVWIIYGAWLKRKRNEHYRTSCERIIAACKERIIA
jgi:hypothetical protein